MEQFREDYHSQCLHSILNNSPHLNLFVLQSTVNTLSPVRKWEFAVSLLVSGYLVYPSLYQDISSSIQAEINEVLKKRTHELWRSINDQAYSILFPPKGSNNLKFIKGQLQYSELNPEAKLLMAGVVHYSGYKSLGTLFRSDKTQDLSLYSFQYPYVFSYDKSTKKAEQFKDLILPRSALILMEEIHSDDLTLDIIVSLQLSLFKINSFLKDQYRNGKRNLMALLYFNEMKPKKSYQFFDTLMKLPPESDLKNLLTQKNLRLITLPYTSLEDRIVKRVKRELFTEKEKDTEKRLKEMIKQRSFSPMIRGTPSPLKKRKTTETISEVEKEEEEVKSPSSKQTSQKPASQQVSEKPASIMLQAQISESPEPGQVKVSMQRKAEISANQKKLDSIIKSILSPNRSIQKPKFHPEKVGSVNVSNYSPILTTVQRNERSPDHH